MAASALLNALALCAFALAPGERPTVVLLGAIGELHSWATVCAGDKILHTYPADYIAGYVAAWGGVAVLNGNMLGSVNAAGYKPIMNVGWIPHGFDSIGFTDMAVSGSGEFLAKYFDYDDDLYVWSLKRKKLILHVGVRELKRQGMRVPKAYTCFPRVLFAPSGRVVYAAFPGALEPGYDSASVRTVEVSLSTTKARDVGIGEPVGFDGDTLIRLNWVGITGTFFGGGLRMPARSAHQHWLPYFSSIGDRFVVASEDDEGRVEIALRSFPKGRLVAKYTVSGLPEGFGLEDVCAMPGAVSGQGSVGGRKIPRRRPNVGMK